MEWSASLGDMMFLRIFCIFIFINLASGALRIGRAEKDAILEAHNALRREVAPKKGSRPPVCKDKYDHEHCASWASRGECTKNPGWMLSNCARSCEQCHAAPTCKDKHYMCPKWAGWGECNKNPKYMKSSCAKSCNSCPDPTEYRIDLKWSDKLARYAERRVNSCKYKHDLCQGCGENMAYSIPTTKDTVAFAKSAIKGFGDEKSLYSPGWGCAWSSGTCLHYTQIIWKATTEVGCAINHCRPDYVRRRRWNFIVCEYAVQGNIRGQDEMLPPFTG